MRKYIWVILVVILLAGCGTLSNTGARFKITKIVLCEYAPTDLGEYFPAETYIYEMGDNVIVYVEFRGLTSIPRDDMQEVQMIETITLSGPLSVVDSVELFNGQLFFPIEKSLDPGWAWAAFPILMAYVPGDYVVTLELTDKLTDTATQKSVAITIR